MKCTTVIDRTRDEEVLIYAHERTALIQEIEELVTGNETEIIGYREKQIARLRTEQIACFTVEDGRVTALTDGDRWHIKKRLYELEELLGSDFVKINQSCLANIKHIKRFEASIGGALLVLFENGYKDYVSRRQLKIVKERIGFCL